ncbi:unnamed protein product [Paramecium pentaurelia]|uniref:Uncharacterized protein n=1 Tax=Paramecium pentaurelia TaxID=43138 RepID=A0A8S1W8Y2_9CILI|nr:unnamed protein product [Paramecium pentaurelia]
MPIKIEVRTKQKLRQIIAASKKIRKSTNEQQENGQQKLSIPIVKKKEIEQINDKSHSDKFDKLFYPNEPNQLFPHLLQENIIKIIKSFGMSTNIKHIINNLCFFYQNPIDQKIFENYLSYAEENGIIYERQGQYFVSQELIPQVILDQVFQMEQKNVVFFHNQELQEINLNVLAEIEKKQIIN